MGDDRNELEPAAPELTAEIPSSQVRRPFLATMRTVLAAVLSMVLVVVVVGPPVLEAVLAEESLPPGFRAALLTVGAVIAAVAGIITRLMAIPQVNRLLRWIGLEVPPVTVVDRTLSPVKVVAVVPATDQVPSEAGHKVDAAVLDTRVK